MEEGDIPLESRHSQLSALLLGVVLLHLLLLGYVSCTKHGSIYPLLVNDVAASISEWLTHLPVTSEVEASFIGTCH